MVAFEKLVPLREGTSSVIVSKAIRILFLLFFSEAI